MMKIFNARVAIYCDVEIEVPDSFDVDNHTDEELDELIDKALKAAPEPYDTKTGRVTEACGYEVLSIWDETDETPAYWNTPIYEGS